MLRETVISHWKYILKIMEKNAGPKNTFYPTPPQINLKLHSVTIFRVKNNPETRYSGSDSFFWQLAKKYAKLLFLLKNVVGKHILRSIILRFLSKPDPVRLSKLAFLCPAPKIGFFSREPMVPPEHLFGSAVLFRADWTLSWSLQSQGIQNLQNPVIILVLQLGSNFL